MNKIVICNNNPLKYRESKITIFSNEFLTFNFLVSGEIIVITRRSKELSFNRKKLIKVTEKSVIVESPKNDKNPFKKSVKNEKSKLFKILEISFDKFISYLLKNISSSLTNNIIFFSKSSICKSDKL